MHVLHGAALDDAYIAARLVALVFILLAELHHSAVASLQRTLPRRISCGAGLSAAHVGANDVDLLRAHFFAPTSPAHARVARCVRRRPVAPGAAPG